MGATKSYREYDAKKWCWICGFYMKDLSMRRPLHSCVQEIWKVSNAIESFHFSQNGCLLTEEAMTIESKLQLFRKSHGLGNMR